MLKSTLIAAALASASATTYFKESFDGSWADRWVSGKDSGRVGLSAGKWYNDATADQGLQTQQDAKFYHVSSTFPSFSNAGKDLVLQFSVKHAQNIDCGGGYLKFLPSGLDQTVFNGDSAYNIMFGPDICGATKKVHVIFNYKGKNHLIKDTIPAKTDVLTHTYTLIVRPDQTFEVQIDGETVKDGNLVDKWDFLEPKMIKDPAVSKPAGWVDKKMMDDPEDQKPEGYDDIPKTIVDPDASKPSDWSDEDDGAWEAPQIPNPAFKGPWRPKQIENPEYKGPWVHPEIANPEYKEDLSIYSYPSFGAVGVDVWQVKSGSIFDNIIITDSVAEASAFAFSQAARDAEKAMHDAAEAEKVAAEKAERDAAAALDQADDQGHDEL